jgi:hypothetical protein
VIVAAGAGDSEAHQPAASHINAIVDDVGQIVEKTPAQREKAHGRLGLGRRQSMGHQAIRRELLEQELVIGNVAVKSFDHIIAIGVSEGITPLVGKDIAFGVRVAGDIKPVARPALAVVR